MTFFLHRAERADVLADALAELLLELPGDPFTPEVVAVHSRGVERWLSHRLAARLGTSPGRSDGVCANLWFPFPGRLVGDALAAATAVDPWLEVLAAHLGGADPVAGDRDRRFAAVRHLADLFDRYAVHRPAMLQAWAAGSDEDGDMAALPADMAWQAELWRQLRRVIDAPSPPERLLAGCAALVEDPTLADLPDRITLFGLTRLPASYLDVLHALAAHRDVHVLALQPSPAAWASIAALPTRDRVSPPTRSGIHCCGRGGATAARCNWYSRPDCPDMRTQWTAITRSQHSSRRHFCSVSRAPSVPTPRQFPGGLGVRRSTSTTAPFRSTPATAGPAKPR